MRSRQTIERSKFDVRPFSDAAGDYVIQRRAFRAVTRFSITAVALNDDLRNWLAARKSTTTNPDWQQNQKQKQRVRHVKERIYSQRHSRQCLRCKPLCAVLRAQST